MDRLESTDRMKGNSTTASEPSQAKTDRMAYRNVLDITSRTEFRGWLEQHSRTEKECYVCATRGRPKDDDRLWYIDAVEEALCFGWIDSTIRTIDGRRMQRFSPRRKNGNWTELNKERVRRLERLGLMTDAGRAVLPPMDDPVTDEEIESALKDAGVWCTFTTFHPLYQRVRISNLCSCRDRDRTSYEKALRHLIEETAEGRMFGDWNDHGRLLDHED